MTREGPVWLALLTPWFRRARPLFPICPEPWMVLTFVSTAPLPDSLMIGTPPPVVDMVTVPPPVRLTAPPTERNVLFAVALIRILPVFMIVPTTMVELVFAPV